MLRTLNADVAQDRGRMAPSEPNIGDHARLFLLLAAKDLLADDAGTGLPVFQELLQFQVRALLNRK